MLVSRKANPLLRTDAIELNTTTTTTSREMIIYHTGPPTFPPIAPSSLYSSSSSAYRHVKEYRCAIHAIAQLKGPVSMIGCDMLDEDFACLLVRVRSQLDLLTESLIDSSL